MMCDIRLSEDKSPFLVGTKCIILLGEHAAHEWLPETRNNSLGEIRGSLYYINNIPTIASFFPQDAADMRAHEAQLNSLSKEYSPDASEYDDDEEEGDVKRHGKTKRANYAFWVRADVQKCKTILKSGIPVKEYPEPTYINCPNSTELIKVLTENKDKFFYFDMETDYEQQNCQCFSFTFGIDSNGILPIYNVPVLDFNYKLHYTNYPAIFRSLSLAIKNNTIVAHNGSTFDFLVLGYKYKIPVYKCYDTMLAHHRCWPDAEKSLGHAVSHLTWERFHKDEDSKGYQTAGQMAARLSYCGKDVYTMFLVHKALEKYSKTVVGLEHSIEIAMSAIRPYLITTLQGISFDLQAAKKTMLSNDSLMTQYIRIINLLVGAETLKTIRSRMKGKCKALAGSNTQCCMYFHEMLGYPVVARSKKTGKPSLGKKAIFRLALKHNNPVIKFILLYRTLSKSYGTLNFIPWKDDKGLQGQASIDSLVVQESDAVSV